MSNVKKIHFVGIKGVGMAPLAIIAKQAGFYVTGCDIAEEFITDDELAREGIEILSGFSEDHINDVDLVISTGAHGGSENVEFKKAIEKNISVLNQGDALGLFQDGEILGQKYFGISVAGSHGKTTTSAIIATILNENKLDPTFVIGTGDIPSLGSSGHFGKGKYFITEADEYVNDAENDKTPKFLFQNPSTILVTNIDFDHPDVYRDVSEIESVFLKFTEKIKDNGTLVVCGDGKYNRDFISKFSGKKITYGMSSDNDYVLTRTSISPERMFFRVSSSNAEIGEFSMQVFGEQNAINATGAIALCLDLGLSIDQIKKGISAFRGTKRRSEYVGVLPTGAFLYDDYAHHPVEIKKTIEAFRRAFPKNKLVVIFQPHMYSRTKILFNDFANSFVDADEVIITEIFASFRESNDPNFSSSLLSEEINKFGKKATYSPRLSDVVEYVTSRIYDKNTVVITMGAGDIYKISKEIMNG